MRLLEVREDDSFSLVEYTNVRDVPPYAIFSHTWGEDHEEVKYKDLLCGDYKDRLGYQKLLFCAKASYSR
jgi:hypothetical protein